MCSFYTVLARTTSRLLYVVTQRLLKLAACLAAIAMAFAISSRGSRDLVVLFFWISISLWACSAELRLSSGALIWLLVDRVLKAFGSFLIKPRM
ncbi:hypothetical protein BKA67DRAFT_582600 [Truncatella angustata]|uniref:Uncharacterized protein n=1 Tax=Truncatella angustata TaxID=152316 RepID=A0A9P8U939_9PEZI|nr:uncharacterized protein BKA67DRAFT_582600 [Truncatella angustata]KAH6645874.1 hypothetical protein BKA67DRAFT_582600 [Truncatella angustata]